MTNTTSTQPVKTSCPKLAKHEIAKVYSITVQFSGKASKTFPLPMNKRRLLVKVGKSSPSWIISSDMVYTTVAMQVCPNFFSYESHHVVLSSQWVKSAVPSSRPERAIAWDIPKQPQPSRIKWFWDDLICCIIVGPDPPTYVSRPQLNLIRPNSHSSAVWPVLPF